jgi:hypothetical protein
MVDISCRSVNDVPAVDRVQREPPLRPLLDRRRLLADLDLHLVAGANRLAEGHLRSRRDDVAGQVVIAGQAVGSQLGCGQ